MVQVQSTWFPLIDRNPQKFVPNIFSRNRPTSRRPPSAFTPPGRSASTSRCRSRRGATICQTAYHCGSESVPGRTPVKNTFKFVFVIATALDDNRHQRALQDARARIVAEHRRSRRSAEGRAVRRRSQARRERCDPVEGGDQGDRRIDAADQDPGDHLPLRPLSHRAGGELAHRAAARSVCAGKVDRARTVFGVGPDPEPAADSGPRGRTVPALPQAG